MSRLKNSITINPPRQGQDGLVHHRERRRGHGLRAAHSGRDEGDLEEPPFEAEITFAPVEGGTWMDVNIEMFLRGPAKLIGPMFMRWYSRSWDQGLVNLKRMMESGEL